MNNLKLIKNTISHDDRIQARIDAFYYDIKNGDGSMRYVEDILRAISEYMVEYEDEHIYMSAIKVQEAIFYLAEFNHYE